MFFVFCDLIGYSGPEVYLGGRYSSQSRDSSSLPLPPNLMGGIKYPSTWARDSSSLPVYYSGGAEWSGGGGSGKYSPTPAGGSAGLSLHLNPTTLAMLQQHNYIPYFRGIKARWDQDQWSNADSGRVAGNNCCCQTPDRNQNLPPFHTKKANIWKWS